MKTAVKHATRHPVWEEDLKLLVHVPDMQALTIELRDWDLLRSHRQVRRLILLGALSTGARTESKIYWGRSWWAYHDFVRLAAALRCES